ncbi:MAG: YbaB/EbfC family nucleoid-associated protein [Coriobacteriales bacterium]|jgi:DNA-binding YbaB/EbfC family protein
MAMDMNRMMKQAREMQAKMEKAQAELAEREFSATAGGGVVKAVVTGEMHLKSIEIDPEAVDPDDVEILQDMIVAAVNEALSDVQETTSSTMDSITGGLRIPGM